MANGPIDIIHNGAHLQLQPGESPRQAMQRQADLLEAKRRETVELRAKVLKDIEAEQKPSDAPKGGGAFRAFGKSKGDNHSPHRADPVEGPITTQAQLEQAQAAAIVEGMRTRRLARERKSDRKGFASKLNIFGSKHEQRS